MLFVWIPLVAFLFACRIYTILPDSKTRRNRSVRKSGVCSVAVFLGSGGHTSEALTLMSSLDSRRYNRRTYIVSRGDNMSVQKALDLEAQFKAGNQNVYSILTIPRARQVHQSLLATPLSALHSLLACTYHVTLRPLCSSKKLKFADVLILNGPGTCFMLCMAVYINKFLGLHAPLVVYVETFARVKSLSISGTLIRPFADR
ncbi:UDP-N-acetylglucosamine transferase subunit ALG14 [Flammula alnicola]|nr:UDP-N-acetylglucosamine transferase subunit ALG14 [Flammula alnicola]